MIKLYGLSVSPFTRKVLATLKVKNLDFEWEKNTSPANLPDGYEAIHPLKKIPALVDGSLSLADSSVMCYYLENKYTNTTSVYPKSPEDRATALWFEEYADSKLFELLGKGLFFEKIVKPKLRQEPTDEAVVSATLAALPNELAYLEKSINSNNYLVGNSLTIADISVASIFVNAMYAGLTIDAATYPKLTTYLAAINSTPAFEYCLNEDKALFALLG